MKPQFSIQFLCFILLGLCLCSISFEGWNHEVDRVDRVLRASFLGPRLSQRIEVEALCELGNPENGSSRLLPTHKEMGLETTATDVRALDQWAAELAETLLSRMHRILCRLGVALLMFPLNGLVVFCFIGDGLLGRRIKQLRFDYPSPLVHRLTLHGFTGLMVIAFLLIVAPLPFPPQEVIGVTVLCAWILEMHLLHLPKRI